MALGPDTWRPPEVRLTVGCNCIVEVFVDTPLDVFAFRDVKRMYAEACRGVRGFMGIDDPSEPPENSELMLETVQSDPDRNARRSVERPQTKGFVHAYGLGPDPELLMPEASRHRTC